MCVFAGEIDMTFNYVAAFAACLVCFAGIASGQSLATLPAASTEPLYFYEQVSTKGVQVPFGVLMLGTVLAGLYIMRKNNA